MPIMIIQLNLGNMKKLLIFCFLFLTIQCYSQQWFRSYDLGKLPAVAFNYYVSTGDIDFAFVLTTTRGKSASKTKLKGVAYSITNTTPTFPADGMNNWSAASNYNGDGSFQINVDGLLPNQTYYCRLFAINNVGIAYGDQFTYTTHGVANYYVPTVQTASSLTELGCDYAYVGGAVSDDGGVTPSSYGVCWGTSSNPTLSNDNSTGFAGNYTSFVAAASPLLPSTTYHARAYATNTIGTGYGSDISFTTTSCGSSIPPSVEIYSVNDISTTQAYCSGGVTSQGSSPVTIRGFCWGTSINPDVENNVVSCGSGLGAFSCYASGLTSNTTYHVRAFAANSYGTSYSDDISFTTSCKPTVTTSAASNIGGTSATLSGTVVAENGYSVTSRGVCWSTSTNPTTANDYLINGSGTGAFQVNASSLLTNTKYYARAFAVNSCGTEYGNQIEFTTLYDNNCDLSWFVLLANINTECSAYTFSGSLTLAQQACSDWFNPTCCYSGGICGLSGITVKANSLNVGQQIYEAYTPPCSALTVSGYYLWLGGTVGPAHIITVVNGIITGNTQCYP